MAKRRTTENPEQMELIPECSDASKKKLRRLLAKMDDLDAKKKAARELYDSAEDDVIAFVRDDEKVMPDKDGNYRIRLDAEETITIGHGKSKVKVTRSKSVDESEDEEDESDDVEAA